MDLGSNIIAGIAALFLAVAAVFSFLNKNALTTELMLLDRAESNVAAARVRFTESEDSLKFHETELATAETTRDGFRKDKSDTDLEIADTEAEVAQLKVQAQQVETKMVPIREQVAKLGELDLLKKQIESIQTNIARLEGEVANRNETLDLAVARLQGLDGNIGDFKSLESRQRRGIPDPDFNAGVSSVHPGWGFIVLDSGNQDGLYANAQLDVVRGDEVVGQVKVSTVEQDIAVASVVGESFGEGNYPHPGDRVVPSAVAVSAVLEEGGEVPQGPQGVGQTDNGLFPQAPAPAPAPAGNDPFGGMGGMPAAPAAPAGDPFGGMGGAAPAAPPAGDPFGGAAPAPAAPAPAGGAAPTADPFGN